MAVSFRQSSARRSPTRWMRPASSTTEIAANVETWKKQIVEVGAQIMDVDRTPFVERAKQMNQKWQQEGFGARACSTKSRPSERSG